MEEQKKKMGRPKGSKDKKPRKKDEYARSSVKNLEKARANSPIMQDQTRVMAEGYNARLVKFILAITPTEPLDKNDVAEMKRRFQHYLEMCAEWDMKVGNQAAYLAIGITKNQAFEWTNTNFRNPERSSFIKKVQQFCGMFREGLMQDGKVNPVTGIFWQKNYDGLKDQTETILTPNNPLGEQKSAEALQQKYLEAAYDGSGNLKELPESQKAVESDFSEIFENQSEGNMN